MSSGFLDEAWEGAPLDRGVEDDGKRATLLQKDMRIVTNTAAVCTRALGDEEHRVAQATALADPETSDDLRGAVRDETAALQACATELNAAAEHIESRFPP